jgi:hypothetical protein
MAVTHLRIITIVLILGFTHVLAATAAAQDVDASLPSNIWPSLCEGVFHSRRIDNRHLASDVIFGAALGVTSGWTVVGHHRRQSHFHRFRRRRHGFGNLGGVPQIEIVHRALTDAMPGSHQLGDLYFGRGNGLASTDISVSS